MGLPGSGKTTLAKELQRTLVEQLSEIYVIVNADYIRNLCRDFDFSPQGRLRQAHRMATYSKQTDNTICDFICPTNETRRIFNADFTIWLNTIQEGRYADTNALFEPPTTVDVEVTSQDAEFWANYTRTKLKCV